MSLAQENEVLSTLASINLEASNFYKMAAQTSPTRPLEHAFSNLEHLHRTILMDLVRRIQDNGGQPSLALVETDIVIFDELRRSLDNIDDHFILRLEQAADACLTLIEQALRESRVRTDTKALLLHELSQLRKSYSYMQNLRDIIRNS